MARLHRFGLGVLLLAASAALAAAAPPSAAVRYLSADQVYLDAGSAAGFAEGDTLKVLRKGQVSATLLVLHAAEHSASCRLLTGKAPVLGDRVQGVARGETAAPPPVDTTPPVVVPPPTASARLLVTPERLVPGKRASAWAPPMTTASVIRPASRSRVPRP